MSVSAVLPALLVLADGTTYPGWSFGAMGTTIGEVVFNTGMTGYQEVQSAFWPGIANSRSATRPSDFRLLIIGVDTCVS